MADRLQPYRGLFVLDASQGIAGPYCATLLAACGADVVKIEPPAGDWSRGLSTREGTQSVMHVSLQPRQAQRMLDLQSEAGRAAMLKLAARADVMLEAFRPGVAKRLGLVPEAGKPDVVFLSISGFGQQGPHSERPCTDSVMQAYSGMVSLNVGMDGVPHRTGQIMAVDMVTGLSAFIAVQAALAEQAQDRVAGAAPRRAGARRLPDAERRGADGLQHRRAGAARPGAAGWPICRPAPTRAATAAGSWSPCCGSRNTSSSASSSAGRELAADPRFASFAAAGRAPRRPAAGDPRRLRHAAPAAEWVQRFQAARMLCDLVNTPLDWLADPHAQAIGAAVPLDQPGLGTLPFPRLPGLGPWSVPAPGLGEHTEEVLREIGL